jgi:hypothetical protein
MPKVISPKVVQVNICKKPETKGITISIIC